MLTEELCLLSKIGIEPKEDPHKSRKLVFETNQDDVEIMILRAADVATYVEHGIADLGMSGKDVLLENIQHPALISKSVCFQHVSDPSH